MTIDQEKPPERNTGKFPRLFDDPFFAGLLALALQMVLLQVDSSESGMSSTGSDNGLGEKRNHRFMTLLYSEDRIDSDRLGFFLDKNW